MRGPENEIPNEDDHSEEENLDHLLNFPPLDMSETALVTTQPGNIDQSVPLLAPNEENEPLFPHLTPDVSLIILRLLSSTDLRHVSWMNRTGLWLSTIVRIERYRGILANSLLWRFLPLMAQNLPEAGGIQFIEYFERGANVRVPQDLRIQYQSLSSFWATLVGTYRHPLNWNGALVNDWTQLQAMAQGIIHNLPSDLSKPPATLHQFMNLCAAGCSKFEELELYQRYHELEALMSTFFLFQSMAAKVRYNRAHPNQPDDLVSALIDPRRTRWLTGFGLVALDSYVPGIFETLVREALRIFQLEHKNEAQEQRLKGIESLLGRLSEADLLTYIPPEIYNVMRGPAPIDALDRQAFYDPRKAGRKRKIFIDVIEARYEFLMRKLTETVLFKIERTDCTSSARLSEVRVIPHILKSQLLLSKLSSNGILKILTLIDMDDQDAVITDYPVLTPFLTFDLLTTFLNQEECTCRLAYTILCQAKFLVQFDNAQVISIAKRLGPLKFGELLNNAAFQERLNSDKDKNELLMQLVKLTDHSFDSVIAKNPYTASLLTLDQIIYLFNAPRLHIRDKLLIHDCIVDKLLRKLSPKELTEALHNYPEFYQAVALNKLADFERNDVLVIFCRIGFRRKDTEPQVQTLLKSLPSELERRSASLTSSQWLELGCMHPAIGLFIADKYLIHFTDTDLAQLKNACSENAHILEKIRAFKDRRAQERDTARFEAQRREMRAEALALLSQPAIVPVKVKAVDNGYVNKILAGLLIIVGLIGICLLALGIASAIGIPIAITITTALFSFLPWSTALTTTVTGFVLHMFSGLCLALVSKNSTKETPYLTAGSNLRFFSPGEFPPEVGMRVSVRLTHMTSTEENTSDSRFQKQ